MTEINFCPFCNASHYRLVGCPKEIFYCKDCSRFFSLEERKLKCLKCDSSSIIKSGFPSPTGEVVFQCSSCKNMFSSTEFFKKNK